MTGRDEIIVENEADARETLDTERCLICGALLRDHYDARGEWHSCRLTAEQERRFVELVEDPTGFRSEAQEVEFSRVEKIEVGDVVRYFGHGPYTVTKIVEVAADASGRFGRTEVYLRDISGRSVGPERIEELKLVRKAERPEGGSR